MKPNDATFRPTLFEAARSDQATGDVQISVTVEPTRVRVPGRARVVVRVLQKGRPVDGFPVLITSSRGKLSKGTASTQAGVVLAELRGQPQDVGAGLVRIHSSLWEAEAVLSADVEFVA
jgi:hypothetical protein